VWHRYGVVAVWGVRYGNGVWGGSPPPNNNVVITNVSKGTNNKSSHHGICVCEREAEQWRRQKGEITVLAQVGRESRGRGKVMEGGWHVVGSVWGCGAGSTTQQQSTHHQ